MKLKIDPKIKRFTKGYFNYYVEVLQLEVISNHAEKTKI